MAAIRLAEFRALSGISDAVLPRDSAIRAIVIASSFANRLAGRSFGGCIESVTQDNSNVIVQCFGHGLPATGKVRLSNMTSSGMSGIKSYTRIDEHKISIANATATDEQGYIQPRFVHESQVMDNAFCCQMDQLLRSKKSEYGR